MLSLCIVVAELGLVHGRLALLTSSTFLASQLMIRFRFIMRISFSIEIISQLDDLTIQIVEYGALLIIFILNWRQERLIPFDLAVGTV
jgi:predicted CDP-diglyceride synthetase/phosphatidate cytidylyltransferase